METPKNHAGPGSRSLEGGDRSGAPTREEEREFYDALQEALDAPDEDAEEESTA